MIDCLHLEIFQCTCTCGHRWTHSYPLCASKDRGLLGGTPTPDQQLKLVVESYTQHYRNFNQCHRCVPLQLSEGWTRPLPAQSFTPKPAAEGRATTPSAAEDLLA